MKSEQEGPGNERWVIGRHVDRILEATAVPLENGDVNREIWESSISYEVMALAHLARTYTPREKVKEWGLKDAVAVEDWLEVFGNVYASLREEGVVGRRRLPVVDARTFFLALDVDDGSGDDGDEVEDPARDT